jgi:hypothetical protein
MPQLTDSFLDRIVDLTSRNVDREYRQRLADEIKNASIAVIPAEMAVRYDRELIDSFGRAAGAADSASATAFRAAWDGIVRDVRQIIDQVNEVYVLASRQLYPETELYRILGPAVTQTQRGVSARQLATWAFVAFLIAIPLTLLGVLLHNRVREEEILETRLADDEINEGSGDRDESTRDRIRPRPTAEADRLR